MNVTTIGIDLAKMSFSVHGVDDRGKTVFRQNVGRAKLLSFMAQQPSSLIGMEACSGAHHWGRSLTALGHRVGIMASRFVAPYRKGGKNDGNDAEAICEAVARPGMRFVPIKSAEQQAVLCLHRIRQGLIKERTAAINQLRGLLAEFGLVMPKGRYPAQHHIPRILEDAENGLPMLSGQAVARCESAPERHERADACLRPRARARGPRKRGGASIDERARYRCRDGDGTA